MGLLIQRIPAATAVVVVIVVAVEGPAAATPPLRAGLHDRDIVVILKFDLAGDSEHVVWRGDGCSGYGRPGQWSRADGSGWVCRYDLQVSHDFRSRGSSRAGDIKVLGGAVRFRGRDDVGVRFVAENTRGRGSWIASKEGNWTEYFSCKLFSYPRPLSLTRHSIALTSLPQLCLQTGGHDRYKFILGSKLKIASKAFQVIAGISVEF